MKIVLKSIKHSAFASHETVCYEASLHVDGRKIGTVGNDGQGGCDTFHGDQTAYAAVDAWCRANLPKWTGYEGEPNDTDLEYHCGKLVDDWLAERQFKSTLRSNVMFVKAGDGRLYQVRHRGEIERTVAAVTRQHPGANVLNGQPLGVALAIYRTATAP